MRERFLRLKYAQAWLAALAVASLTTTSALAADAPVYDYGQRPSYQAGTKLAEAYVKQNLADPASAQFEWPFDFAPISTVPLFKRISGYATCGFVNAKNRMGGYVGQKEFRVIIRNGEAIDYEEVSDLRWVPDICKDMQVKFGMGPAPKPHLPLGVRFQPGANGIQFISVAPQSVAALAGITPGQVALSVNGTDLRGKSPEDVAAIIERAPDVLIFTMANGSKVSVDRGEKPAL